LARVNTPLSCVPGIEWPALPTAAGAQMLAMLWQLERSQWWPGEVLLENQFRQLRELAGHAAANVPYYRDALRRAGISSTAELNPENFRRWPVLRKSELRANEGALRALHYPKEHGPLGGTSTTGSTGIPVRVAYTELAYFFSQALFIRDHLLHERDFSQKLALINTAVQRGSLASWGSVDIAFPTGPVVTLSSSTDVSEQLDWLVAERPSYLVSQANNLRALLLRSRETGKRPAGIRQLVTISDMPPPDLKSLAAECWGASLAATYITEECGTIASQAPGYDHYLVHAETFYVEVLRDDGTPCADGETGRLVVTPLHNFAMPLLRYELGDWAEKGSHCPSGRGLPVLNRILGRTRNMAQDPTGRRFWPSFPAELFTSVAPIRQLQLVQRTASAIEVRYAMERELSASQIEHLTAALRKKLGYPYELSFSRVTKLDTASGKFEDFVSELAGG
jgi:phenylacetate-CoA ligase